MADDDTAIEAPALQQGWALDATGNWTNFTQTDSSDPTRTLDQQRVANRVNEITSIARTVGANWATPAYDRNGNMSVIPQPQAMTESYVGVWDAWNRLIKLVDSATDDTVAEYAYDGQTWRTVNERYNNGELVETRHVYFTAGWQAIEERPDDPDSEPDQQFIWGLRYIDDLILRNRTAEDPLDERLYSLQDARFSVVAIADAEGEVVERFAYQPYGESTALDPDFSSYSGDDYEWNYRFTGRELDLRTGLQINRYRYLHLQLGCWLSRDPIGYGSRDKNPRRSLQGAECTGCGDSSSRQICRGAQVACRSSGMLDENLYRYVRLWPTVSMDPEGLQNLAGCISRAEERERWCQTRGSIICPVAEALRCGLNISDDITDLQNELQKRGAQLPQERRAFLKALSELLFKNDAMLQGLAGRVIQALAEGSICVWTYYQACHADRIIAEQCCHLRDSEIRNKTERSWGDWAYCLGNNLWD